MWFHRARTNFNTFDLYYAESSDGIFWDNFTKLLFTNETTWDQYSQTAPSVIYDSNENKYKMWYSGSGYFNSDPQRWRIGYAFSSDGITWTKNANPVLDADQEWEDKNNLAGVSNPHVLKISNKYHLWYHSKGKIGYALSNDEITWTKHSEPILSPLVGTYYSKSVWDPYVVYDNNQYYLFFSAIGSSVNLGVASDISLPDVIIPTQTPTPTLTPTPTIPKDSPIVILPGLGASWNTKDMVSCGLSSSAKWVQTPYYASVYDRLFKTLENNAHMTRDKNLFIYYYDWRKPLDEQVILFRKYLDDISKKTNSKVRLIGHSMGGLLIRGYLSDYPGDDRVYKAMTVGTPHTGTVLAYPLWANGDIWFTELGVKIPITLLLNYCRLVKTTLNLTGISKGFVTIDVPTYKLLSQKETIQSLAPSIESLLPVFNYLQKNGNLIDSTSLISQNNWLKNHLIDNNRIKMITDTISGNNRNTLKVLSVKPPSKKDLKNKNWVDGVPIAKEFDKQGDGTILNLSSILPNINNMTIEGDHIQIIYSDEALNKILEFLDLEDTPIYQKEPVPIAEAETAIVLMSDKNAEIRATNMDKNTINSQENLLSLFNPQTGNYKIQIKGDQNDQTVLQTALLNKVSDTEVDTYSVKLKKNVWMNYLLIYTPNNPNKLVLVPY
ncbi:MAG: PGAP1 family protein [Candidatus Gottesmanbacteria bacterium GW2011_GWA2_43_14]|uniref:PGAP1 family protein n=1 Tax=Candidatus Gottesmanbacteria bacterium GW2011_GWA2_43_14 TaxID=1618443 RepID=A0A0G1GIC8_9BACT|nr:MAG: PGAP1 family protein [Candidatus Gottesmanbacteria bacterium GW2011_GWA2_43_14]